MRRIVVMAWALMGCLGMWGQEQAGQVDVFCGADLSYGDTNYLRLYNVLLNLTPGARWNMGHDWTLAAQTSFAVVNEGFEKRQGDLRLSMATLSKEWTLGNDQHVKATGGLFGKERCGLDLRWMMPVTDWLMVQARAGLTNDWWLSTDEQIFGDGQWKTLGIVGANVWIDRWTTELRLHGGRYMNEDWGVEGEAYCHFKHCSVGAFLQLHEKAQAVYTTKVHSYSGGFRVVMMLPPYKKATDRGTVRVRPASNFRLTYNAQSDGYSMKRYHTDPEENEREYQTKVKWGTGLYR